jgi:hypothetical protein
MNITDARRGGLLLLACGAAAGQANSTDECVLAKSSGDESRLPTGGNFRGEEFSPLIRANRDRIDALGLAAATKDGRHTQLA